MMPAVLECQTPRLHRRRYDHVVRGAGAASGTVIAAQRRRHRAIEFRKFLNQINRETPPELDVRLVLDNYGTHKAPIIKDWLLIHPRFLGISSRPTPAG